MLRCIKNCSNRILANTEWSILTKELIFAVIPKRVPLIELVAATESAYRTLKGGDVNELRAKVVNILSRNDNIKVRNISKEEWMAMESLKKDDMIMVLPTDKGRVTMMMKKDYLEKCK